MGIPVNNLYGWQRDIREGRLDIGLGAYTLQIAVNLAEELNSCGEK